MKSLIMAVLAAVPIALAPAASADPTDYLNDLERFGFDMESDTDRLGLLAVGLGVCVNIFNGSTARDEIAELQSIGVESAAASNFVQIAIADLCPLAGGQLS